KALSSDLSTLSLLDALPICSSRDSVMAFSEGSVGCSVKNSCSVMPKAWQIRSSVGKVGTLLRKKRLARVDWGTPASWARRYTLQDRKSTRLNSSHVSISYAV